MKDLFVIMLILIGAAVALLVAFLALPPGPSPPTGTTSSTRAEQALIPEAIPGFILERIDRAEPSFPGELFSVTAVFVPEPGSPYEGAVASMGVTVFRLESPRSGSEITSTLLLLADETETITVEGVAVESFLNESQGMAGLVWQQGALIYNVLASAVEDAASEDLQTLNDAVTAAAEAIIGET